MSGQKAGGGAFKKGDPRINRSGRSKAVIRASKKLQKAILGILREQDKVSPDVSKTNLRAILEMAVSKAKGGDDKSREFLFDRGFGKPPQQVSAEVSGKDGAPIQNQMIWDISAGMNADSK